jgi:hypothetical protein
MPLEVLGRIIVQKPIGTVQQVQHGHIRPKRVGHEALSGVQRRPNNLFSETRRAGGEAWRGVLVWFTISSIWIGGLIILSDVDRWRSLLPARPLLVNCRSPD